MRIVHRPLAPGQTDHELVWLSVSVVGFGNGLAEDKSLNIDSISFDEVEMGRMAYTLWKSKARGLVRRHAGRLVVRGSVAGTR